MTHPSAQEPFGIQLRIAHRGATGPFLPLSLQTTLPQAANIIAPSEHPHPAHNSSGSWDSSPDGSDELLSQKSLGLPLKH